jgi:hypothetical protein
MNNFIILVKHIIHELLPVTSTSKDVTLQVEIQYCGNGELVEVAGSFNGWHRWIRLDPQPSSSIWDNFGSRFLNILFFYVLHTCSVIIFRQLNYVFLWRFNILYWVTSVFFSGVLLICCLLGTWHEVWRSFHFKLSPKIFILALVAIVE